MRKQATKDRPMIATDATIIGDNMLFGRTLEECKVIVYWLWAIATVAGVVVIAASFMSNWLMDQISNKTEANAKAEIERVNEAVSHLTDQRNLGGGQVQTIKAGLRMNHLVFLPVTFGIPAHTEPQLSVGAVPDPESQAYARHFIQLFIDEHIPTKNGEAMGYAPFPITQFTLSDNDINITYRTGAQFKGSEKCARLLQSILAEAGLKARIQPSEEPLPAFVNLQILPKPPQRDVTSK